jgi:hypothetical protein
MSNELEVRDDKPANYANAIYNASDFEKAAKMAAFLSKSTFIPRQFQNKPSDCLIAMQMAASLRVTPFEVMKGIYVIDGKPAFTAQFALALVNRFGPFDAPIKCRTTGSGLELCVTAYAKFAGTEEEATATATMKGAHAAGWTKNRNYEAIPEQMLFYKAALMLIRRYCPHILMGMLTEDEVKSTSVAPKKNAVDVINELICGGENENEVSES